jgi:hypothetical protein
MKFKPYVHVENLGNTEVKDIAEGECFIFPKLDGTNASVWLEKGEIQAGSRKRQLTLEQDNAGFYKWVVDNKELLAYFIEHPHHKLHGEWLVPHSLKTYEDTAWRNFYVFDVFDELSLQFLHYDEYKPLLWTFHIDCIPPLAIIMNPTYDKLTFELDGNRYLIKPDSGAGEGIVIKRYDFINQYGRTTWAKIVREECKQHRGAKKVRNPKETLTEQAICDMYVTVPLIEKVHYKIVCENNGWSSKYIPRLLQTVFYDLVREEIWSILKKFKNPTINFRTLQVITIAKIKQHKPELF